MNMFSFNQMILLFIENIQLDSIRLFVYCVIVPIIRSS